ncbi:MAG: septum formation initiator family protein [Candidatus Paceibacterota bacterium]|jgi:cell division protein FtsB
MKHFEAKKQIKSKFYSKYTIAGLLILVALLANGVWNIYSRERQSAVMRSEAENRLAAIEKQKESLKKQTDRLEGEEGIEEEIRSKFNVVKPGEKVVMIVNPEAATTTATSTGFWGSLWQKIWP